MPLLRFLAVFSLVLFLPALSRAEALRYGEVELPVSVLERLNGGAALLSIGGEVAVVAAGEPGRTAVLRIFALGLGDRLSVGSFEQILLQALEAQHLDVARAALAAGSAPESGAVSAKLCVLLLKSVPQAGLQSETRACQERSFAEAERLVEQGQVEEALALASTAGGAESWGEPLRQVQAALAAAESAEASRFWASVHAASVEKSAMEGGIIRAALRTAMANSRRDFVLDLVLRSNFSRRSTLEHSAVQWLLENPANTASGEGFDQQACAVFAQYASKDELVAALLPDSCPASERGWQIWLVVAAVISLFAIGWSKRMVASGLDDSYQQPALNAEHEQLLAFFGLSPGASLKEIKSAYRATIKAIHPDRRRGMQQGAASEEFIEATQRYEKLLRSHSQLGADGSEQKQQSAGAGA